MRAKIRVNKSAHHGNTVGTLPTTPTFARLQHAQSSRPVNMAEAAAANYPSSNRSWEVGGSTSTVRGWRVAETLLNLIRMDHDGRTTTFETMTIDEIDDEFLRLLITRVATTRLARRIVVIFTPSTTSVKSAKVGRRMGQ